MRALKVKQTLSENELNTATSLVFIVGSLVQNFKKSNS